MDKEQAEQQEKAGSFMQAAVDVGSLVIQKNEAYGDSFRCAKDFLRLLYPAGVKPEQYMDLLAIVRVFDKLKRIATDKDALGENPWQDVAGYGILSMVCGESNAIIKDAVEDMMNKVFPAIERKHDRARKQEPAAAAPVVHEVVPPTDAELKDTLEGKRTHPTLKDVTREQMLDMLGKAPSPMAGRAHRLSATSPNLSALPRDGEDPPPPYKTKHDQPEPPQAPQKMPAWAEVSSQYRRPPGSESVTVKLGISGILELHADACHVTLAVCHYMWVEDSLSGFRLRLHGQSVSPYHMWAAIRQAFGNPEAEATLFFRQRVYHGKFCNPTLGEDKILTFYFEDMQCHLARGLVYEDELTTPADSLKLLFDGTNAIEKADHTAESRLKAYRTMLATYFLDRTSTFPAALANQEDEPQRNLRGHLCQAAKLSPWCREHTADHRNLLDALIKVATEGPPLSVSDLEVQFTQAHESTGADLMVIVLGPAGTGKSWLVNEFHKVVTSAGGEGTIRPDMVESIWKKRTFPPDMFRKVVTGKKVHFAEHQVRRIPSDTDTYKDCRQEPDTRPGEDGMDAIAPDPDKHTKI